ncbi:nicotinamide riboside kinase [Novosphingobium capsulatum]|uniref:Nicotinamide riboside kinase n=1 Tax=Novosphingobium capsulatum TaxID=13688 RepID=A0ABU1MM56_9SPHN|nr:hypothetical protein [Novosphingobium capsulatum]MDR6511430.1 nicotinamide riboside kinase [Novosphingobium capsulatum]
MTEPSKEAMERAQGLSGYAGRDCNFIPVAAVAGLIDQHDAALQSARAEIERLRETVRRVQASAKTLDATQSQIYDHYRKASVINVEAVATLDSERAANAILTNEIERLREALESAAIWHEDQDKAISKQPNANTGDNGWRRMEHQAQRDEIRQALEQSHG